MKVETGEYSVRQAIKWLGPRCRRDNAGKGSCKEELLAEYPDGRAAGWVADAGKWRQKVTNSGR